MNEKCIVCVLGLTGTGKSATYNTIADKSDRARDAFGVSNGIKSFTFDTTAKEVTWFDGDGKFILVDKLNCFNFTFFYFSLCLKRF